MVVVAAAAADERGKPAAAGGQPSHAITGPFWRAGAVELDPGAPGAGKPSIEFANRGMRSGGRRGRGVWVWGG